MSATELTEGPIIFLCMCSQKATPPVPAAPKRPVGYSNECAIQLVAGRFSEPHTSFWGVLGVAFRGRIETSSGGFWVSRGAFRGAPTNNDNWGPRLPKLERGDSIYYDPTTGSSVRFLDVVMAEAALVCAPAEGSH